MRVRLAALLGCFAHVSARLRGQTRYAQFLVDSPSPLASFQSDSMDGYLNTLNATGDVPSADEIAAESLHLAPLNATVEANAPRRQVVVAKYDEDISWLSQLPKNFDVRVYQSKDAEGSDFVENVGNEASKYLTYIVQNYDSLPDSVIFLQAGRQDWHDPVAKDLILRAWSWDNAASNGGMASLPTNAPCLIEDSEVLPARAPLSASVLEKEHCIAVSEHEPKQMQMVREVWGDVFEPELGPLPQRWLTHCCAQFEVTRAAVQKHPVSFYRGLLDWVKNHDTQLASESGAEEMRRNHDSARRDAGHVMEVVWALLFSETATSVV